MEVDVLDFAYNFVKSFRNLCKQSNFNMGRLSRSIHILFLFQGNELLEQESDLASFIPRNWSGDWEFFSYFLLLFLVTGTWSTNS